MEAATTTPTTAQELAQELAHFDRLRSELQNLHRGVQADLARLDTMLRTRLREIEPPRSAPEP